MRRSGSTVSKTRSASRQVLGPRHAVPQPGTPDSHSFTGPGAWSIRCIDDQKASTQGPKLRQGGAAEGIQYPQSSLPKLPTEETKGDIRAVGGSPRAPRQRSRGPKPPRRRHMLSSATRHLPSPPDSQTMCHCGPQASASGSVCFGPALVRNPTAPHPWGSWKERSLVSL
jgi:hypothetical protein